MTIKRMSMSDLLRPLGGCTPSRDPISHSRKGANQSSPCCPWLHLPDQGSCLGHRGLLPAAPTPHESGLGRASSAGRGGPAGPGPTFRAFKTIAGTGWPALASARGPGPELLCGLVGQVGGDVAVDLVQVL